MEKQYNLIDTQTKKDVKFELSYELRIDLRI